MKLSPPAVIVPLRCEVEVFAATEKATVPFPVPVAPLVIEIHAAPLEAVQAQQPAVAVTVKLPFVAAAETEVPEEDSEKPQDTAAWLTETACPATVSVPVRLAHVLLAATL